jgi:hypothetical protein
MTRYAPRSPRNIWTVPKGKIAIHNNAEHHAGQKSDENGFRVWFDDPHDDYVECSCGWRPDLGLHYHVRTQHGWAQMIAKLSPVGRQARRAARRPDRGTD